MQLADLPLIQQHIQSDARQVLFASEEGSLAPHEPVFALGCEPPPVCQPSCFSKTAHVAVSFGPPPTAYAFADLDSTCGVTPSPLPVTVTLPGSRICSLPPAPHATASPTLEPLPTKLEPGSHPPFTHPGEHHLHWDSSYSGWGHGCPSARGCILTAPPRPGTVPAPPLHSPTCSTTSLLFQDH